jgi:hypothetical protein
VVEHFQYRLPSPPLSLMLLNKQLNGNDVYLNNHKVNCGLQDAFQGTFFRASDERTEKKRFSLAQTDSTKKGAIVSSLGMTVFGQVHE